LSQHFLLKFPHRLIVQLAHLNLVPRHHLKRCKYPNKCRIEFIQRIGYLVLVVNSIQILDKMNDGRFDGLEHPFHFLLFLIPLRLKL
jgi:hypothetical protein